MFREFFFPELRKMGRWMDYATFHLDGPSAFAIMWTRCWNWRKLIASNLLPAWAVRPPRRPQYIPIFQKIQRAGKRLYLLASRMKSSFCFRSCRARPVDQYLGGFRGAGRRSASENDQVVCGARGGRVKKLVCKPLTLLPTGRDFAPLNLSSPLRTGERGETRYPTATSASGVVSAIHQRISSGVILPASMAADKMNGPAGES